MSVVATEQQPVPLEAFQLVASPDTAPLVADAKRLLTVSYPKLFSRFNHAFHGYEDASELVAAIDAITSDVRAWLSEMPANFKTSAHALSRPKFGLIFVLKNALVRAALGDAKCAAAVAAIERGWETCYKDIVVPKPPQQPAVSATAGGDDSEGTSAAKVRAFAGKIRERLPAIPLLFIDETLTTSTAAAKLREAGRNAKQQKSIIDQAAAVEILNTWMGD